MVPLGFLGRNQKENRGFVCKNMKPCLFFVVFSFNTISEEGWMWTCYFLCTPDVGADGGNQPSPL